MQWRESKTTIDEVCQNVGDKTNGDDKKTKRDGKTNHRESDEMQRLRSENMTMRANLKEFEEQQEEYVDYYEKLLDKSNDEMIEMKKEYTRVQRLLDEAEKELEKLKNTKNKELERVQADNTKVYQFLNKKKKDVQKHYEHYKKRLEDKEEMIASLEKLNTMLSDRNRTQDDANSTLILTRSLLDASVTQLTKTQKHLSSELDKTRIELENTRQELNELKTVVEVQSAELALSNQLVDEHENTIDNRDKTIAKLTTAVQEIDSEKIEFHQSGSDSQQQWVYYPLQDGSYHCCPVVPPYYLIPSEAPITEHCTTHTQSMDTSTSAALNPETRPTKGRDKDDCTKSQCVNTPTGADISIDERSQETLEQTPQLADASPKVTALTISENSHEILEQIRAPTIVEASSETDKHFPHKKTRQGRRGGWKVQMKKQKFKQKMEIKQKVSKHQGMGKMTTAEHFKVNRSD